MKRKRQNRGTPSTHERQMRFFTILFAVLMILVMAGLMWIFNRQHF